MPPTSFFCQGYNNYFSHFKTFRAPSVSQHVGVRRLRCEYTVVTFQLLCSLRHAGRTAYPVPVVSPINTEYLLLRCQKAHRTAKTRLSVGLLFYKRLTRNDSDQCKWISFSHIPHRHSKTTDLKLKGLSTVYRKRKNTAKTVSAL